MQVVSGPRCFLFRLCGYEPFYDDDEQYMYKKIVKGDFEFDPPYWDNITTNAKVRSPMCDSKYETCILKLLISRFSLI